MAKTKVDIISGFLGAGKTTFIKKLLAEALSGEKVVLIENEFGEIGIDGGFLKDSGIEVREMNSGCICCSLVGDFASSLKEILTKYTPDRVIIEPSGVGKLSDVMRAVADVEEELPVAGNSAVTLVDVKKAKLYIKNFGEFFNNQVQYAKTIVLSRTDVADQKKIDEAIQLIREINKDATIITTPLADLSGEKLLEILEHPIDLKAELFEELAEEHEHHHHDEEHEHCCHHDEEEHEHHHHHDEEHEHCCHHDEEEHEHHHHHDEEHEHCCHHDEEEHEHHHHHDEDGHCCCGHDHHHHHHGHDADEVFDSVGLENVPAFTEDKLHALLIRLAESEEFGKVVRAKGMVPSADGGAWFHFDLVPGETEIRRGAAEASGKVCVIGSELKEEAITREFKA
ncbi:CobW family GTP-binding protein [Stomatobaculum longum]|uniref:CobW family GTP-binding protein n=1 Tax=Stomatobaculum longum TaxID=796942 RepID=UPI0028E2BAE4|nr:GTP-binding protein [Stomatobaculum longum]